MQSHFLSQRGPFCSCTVSSVSSYGYVGCEQCPMRPCPINVFQKQFCPGKVCPTHSTPCIETTDRDFPSDKLQPSTCQDVSYQHVFRQIWPIYLPSFFTGEEKGWITHLLLIISFPLLVIKRSHRAVFKWCFPGPWILYRGVPGGQLGNFFCDLCYVPGFCMWFSRT